MAAHLSQAMQPRIQAVAREGWVGRFACQVNRPSMGRADRVVAFQLILQLPQALGVGGQAVQGEGRPVALVGHQWPAPEVVAEEQVGLALA